MTTDTIYALSSAPGRAGVAIVRASGPQALAGLQALLKTASPPPRQAALRSLYHPQGGHVIDRAVILYFPAPASFTGEDIVEYHIHGGRAVLQDLLSALKTQPGHRAAEPGEFTRRGFENNRFDLTQAEAIADLIHAETQHQKAQALGQMDGALARLYTQWAERLARILAYIEADLDFPDEDLPGGITEKARPDLAGLHAEIKDHLNDARRGERLRDGIRIALIGAPNAGKSSLMNVLSQRDVAIVSAMPGTTRDVIEIPLDLGGWPVLLADTAGLRPDQIGTGGHDAIESEGIRRALDYAQNADIRFLLFDASGLPAVDTHTANLVNDDSLVVFNKTDLYAGRLPAIGDHEALGISVATGSGLDRLLRQLTRLIETRMQQGRDAPSLTRTRHRDALNDCAEYLHRALNAAAPELLAEDTRLAIRQIGRITGRVDVEDLLDIIFRDFCIGK